MPEIRLTIRLAKGLLPSLEVMPDVSLSHATPHNFRILWTFPKSSLSVSISEVNEMAGPINPAQRAFEKAIREFRTSLKDAALYSQILKTTSIDEVYDLTDKLQFTQGAHLADLSRIQPYLNRLKAYTGVIDTFVQAKPEILALIWGPIKLLLQWTSNVSASLSALANTIEEIGTLLPEFDQAARLFGSGPHVNDVLALLFQDILDFYLISVKFFSMKSKRAFTPPSFKEARRIKTGNPTVNPRVSN